MKICVVGAGGLGGFFGGWLASGNDEVTFVARGEHLAAMQSRGLEVRSELGDRHVRNVSAVEDPGSVGSVDVLMFAVKSYDLREVAARCETLVGPETLIVSLLNGVDWVEELRERFPHAHLAAGVTVVPSNIVAPGVVELKGRGTAITLGSFDAGAGRHVEALRDAFVAVGIEARVDTDIERTLWTKFAAWSAGAGVTSLSRQPFGVVQSDPALKQVFVSAVAEAVAVARASGISLADNTVSELTSLFESMPPAAKSSTLVDLENGKRLELAAGAGTVVRLGRQLGIETPVSSTINAALGPFVEGC